VVAIALTLLALELRPALPEPGSGSRALWDVLWAQRDQYVSFVIAFFVIASYWLAHHRMLRGVTASTPSFTWANLLFLFALTLIPTTAYVDGGYGGSLGTTVFAVNLLLTSLVVLWMEALLVRQHLVPPDAVARLRAGRTRALVSVAVPLVVIALAWTVDGHAAYGWFLLLLSDLPRRWRRRA
jgi:uncharacterized membrane protein